MKFSISSKDKEKLEELLERFTAESQIEYDNQTKRLPEFLKDKMPHFLTGYYFDYKTREFVLWNTVRIPNIRLMSPFNTAIKKMTKNIEDFLKSNGITDAKVKVIEN